MRALRTDLALEAAEIFRQGQKSAARLEGILQSESLREGYAVTRTEIVDPAAARAIGKPAGRYVTVDLRPYFRRQGHFFGRGVRCLAAELRALLPPEHGTVLAVGLGNRGMTADAVGPLVLENLLVTRHMETFPFSTAVAALAPGVLAATGMETAELIRRLLSETEKPAVLDADGINALAGHIDILDGRRGRVTVLTPHEGEFARIGDLSGGRARAARDFAVDHGCWLVLKGHRSLTATPWGTVLENATGNCGMAKGGSGDVLTGLIAALLAQGAGPTQAAALGNWLHGRAGDLAAAAWTEYAMTPEDLLSCLPLAFRELTE